MPEDVFPITHGPSLNELTKMEGAYAFNALIAKRYLRQWFNGCSMPWTVIATSFPELSRCESSRLGTAAIISDHNSGRGYFEVHSNTAVSITG